MVISLTHLEAKLKDKGIELWKPGMKGLFGGIRSPCKADRHGEEVQDGTARRLSHEDSFRKKSMQKHILNISLPKRPIRRENKVQKNPNCGRLNPRDKCLIIIRSQQQWRRQNLDSKKKKKMNEKNGSGRWVRLQEL